MEKIVIGIIFAGFAIAIVLMAFAGTKDSKKNKF